MAQNSSERDVLTDVLNTLGLRLRERRDGYSVEASRDNDDVTLRKRLASAGIETVAIEKRLNDGEVVTLAPSVVTLPSPLSPETWSGSVFERAIAPQSVFSAIIRDRQASLLFYGLQAMTPRTRAYLAGNRDLLQASIDNLPVPLRRLGARCVWTTMAGSWCREAPRFATCGKRSRTNAASGSIGLPRRSSSATAAGLVYFMDALARLDPAHQRFALGLWIRDRGTRLERFQALYRTFIDVDPQWVVALRPFGKPFIRSRDVCELDCRWRAG